MDRIPGCTAYRLAGGQVSEEVPFTPLMDGAEPVIEYLPGWKQDISKARSFAALPKEAQDYVRYIEARLDCPVTYVSVGPGRDEIIYR